MTIKQYIQDKNIKDLKDLEFEKEFGKSRQKILEEFKEAMIDILEKDYPKGNKDRGKITLFFTQSYYELKKIL